MDIYRREISTPYICVVGFLAMKMLAREILPLELDVLYVCSPPREYLNLAYQSHIYGVWCDRN
jgi:hypothetical protein